jgi:hypothetical protein
MISFAVVFIGFLSVNEITIAKGKYTIGYDIADSGNDACSTVKVYGNVVVDIKEWKAKEDELEQSAEKVFKSLFVCQPSCNHNHEGCVTD